MKLFIYYDGSLYLVFLALITAQSARIVAGCVDSSIIYAGQSSVLDCVVNGPREAGIIGTMRSLAERIGVPPQVLLHEAVVKNRYSSLHFSLSAVLQHDLPW